MKEIETNKPALECLSAIAIGMIIPILIAAIIRFASEIDGFISW